MINHYHYYFSYIRQKQMSNSTKQIDIINKLKPQTAVFFNELIYGKKLKSYNSFKEEAVDTYLYFNERNIEMLVAIDIRGERKIFDSRLIYIDPSDYEKQRIYQLQLHKYAILKDNIEELILIFNNKAEINDFMDKMNQICSCLQDYVSEYDSVILRNFIKGDVNENMQLSEQELNGILKQMKIVKTKEIQNIIDYSKKWTGVQSKVINYLHFEKMAKILCCRRELFPVFQKYTGCKLNFFNFFFQPFMEKSHFDKFLYEEQHQTIEEQRQKIIKKVFEKNSKISFYQFSKAIMSYIFHAVDSSFENSEMDITRPLTQYYCYSSHNTYLTGNQINSDSRVQRYREDLQNGIRCVQLDTHDGKNSLGQSIPIIFHGGTMTKQITFEATIQQINQFCINNPGHTPIILSIQNHCGNENQYQMAQILDRYFGDKIFRLDIGGQITVQKATYPSLKQLMGKIILKNSGKCKILWNNQRVILEGNQIDAQDQQSDQQTREFKNIISEKIISELNTFKLIQSIATVPQNFLIAKERFNQRIAQLKVRKLQSFNAFRSAQQKISESLFYEAKVKGSSKKCFNLKLLKMTGMLSIGKTPSKEYNSPWQCISIDDYLFQLIYEKRQQRLDRLITYTKKSWVRVYPSGFKIDSSHFNPIPALQSGAQIIALNQQYKDENNQILKAFFRKNSKKYAGYRLKNQIKLEQMANQKQKPLKMLSITPISALKIIQNYRTSEIPSVMVKMKFICCEADTKNNSDNLNLASYTSVVRNNAFSPIFQEKQVFSARFSNEDLAFVYFEIPECGSSVIPVISLKQGFRTISLYDKNLKPKDSLILCKIHIHK